jgi:hypothetical protein
MTTDSHFALTDRRLHRLLWLSIAAAIATIALKAVAWLLTGSVGLLSGACGCARACPTAPAAWPGCSRPWPRPART